MFKVGDICHTTPTSHTRYMVIRISAIITDSFYELETDKGIESCHVRSIMAKTFQFIASNIASLDEAKRLYPEYFV